MTAVATPMLRWSSTRDCALKAIYEATGAPARERSVKEDRILWRGKTLGRDYADLLAAQHGEQAIERERKIIWPLGVGHADVYVKATKTVVEVLSSAHASASYVHSKLLQAVGYAHFDPEAENVCLVVLNPSDYSEERVIVAPSSPQWDVLVAEVEDRLAQVVAWRETGEMPARVCAKPSEARGHFCQHAEHCFDGWTPDPLPIIDTEEARQAAARFAQAKKTEQDAKTVLDQAAKQRREAQAALAEHDLPAGETMIGPFKVKRIPYRGRESFQLALAKEDSRLEPALLAKFTSHSDPYDVYKIERTTDEPIATGDFGDVPWTDDDL